MTLPFLLRGLRPRVLANLPFASRPREAAGEILQFPFAGRQRIALLETSFRKSADLQAFAGDDIAGLCTFAPHGLAAPLGVCLSLADQRRRGLFHLPSLNAAIVVLTSVDDTRLADHHRDLLWHAFGVPLFEQLLGADGRVIARECEVHDGLHLGPDFDVAVAPPGEIAPGVCECGSETLRIRSVAGLAGGMVMGAGGV